MGLYGTAVGVLLPQLYKRHHRHHHHNHKPQHCPLLSPMHMFCGVKVLFLYFFKPLKKKTSI